LPSGAEPGRTGLPAREALQRRGAWRKRDFDEIALVVANGVTRFDEGFAVFGEQHAVAGFFDIGHEHGLLGVTRDGDVEASAGIWPSPGRMRKAIRAGDWRLVTGFT